MAIYNYPINPDDSKPIKVKVLPLYALENIGPDIPGDYTYAVLAADGQIYSERYPIEERLKLDPQPPGEDADEWERIEWDRLQAALLYYESRGELLRERQLNCARHLLESCLEPEDRGRVISPAGYDVVYLNGLAPEVKMEDIERSLRSFFPGVLGGPGGIQGAG